MDSAGVELEQPANLEGADGQHLPSGTPDPITMKQPVILDTFGFPVLYYSANTRLVRAKHADAQIVSFGCANGVCYGSPEYQKGVFNFSDNALFTGLCGNANGGAGGACYVLPWDFVGVGVGEDAHKLSKFGTFDPLHITDDIYSFAYYVLNKEVYESTYDDSTGEGTAVPYRADSYILISPGADGVYGSKDDVNNF
jgi:hypothetical protein